MSQPWRTQGAPSRITGTQIVVTPGGDIAELVSDSCRDTWGRWYSASAASWSDWRHVAKGPEAVAIAGYTGPATAVRNAAAANRAMARAVSAAVAAELERRGGAGTAPEAEASAGVGDDLDDDGSTPEAALVAVVGRSPDDRSFFLLTAAGITPIRL